MQYLTKCDKIYGVSVWPIFIHEFFLHPMLALHQTSDWNSQHRKFLTFFLPAWKSSIKDAKCHGFMRRKPNADNKKQKLMEWRCSGLSQCHRQPRSITSTNSAQYNMLSIALVQKSTRQISPQMCSSLGMQDSIFGAWSNRDKVGGLQQEGHQAWEWGDYTLPV